MAVCTFHRRSLRQLPQNLSEMADVEKDNPLNTVEVMCLSKYTAL